MSDRALQDQVIRALADAPYRASPAWLSRRLADPERLDRYARFLARHFYYERIVNFFKYSRALARVTGRRPEAVLNQPDFDALLPTLVLGSRDSARAVAGLVTQYLSGSPPPIPYLSDLLRYEAAMMVAEAGARIWREQGAVRREQNYPETVEGTVLLELEYDLPAVLPQLVRPWAEPPAAPRRATTLLVARSPHGRVAVARGNKAVAAIVELADGTQTLEQLATRAGLDRAAMEQTLLGLIDLGAVRFSTGS